MKISTKLAFLVLLLCAMAAALAACSSGGDEDKMKEHSEEALKANLADYYEMEEGTYTAKVKKVNTADGTENGVIWTVTSEDDEFSVYLHGTEDHEYRETEVLSDRYSDEFIDFINSEAERTMRETGMFVDLSLTINTTFVSYYFPSSYNIIPISVRPDDFLSFLRGGVSGSINMEIRCYSDMALSLEEDQVEALKQNLPLNSLTITRYIDEGYTTPAEKLSY